MLSLDKKHSKEAVEAKLLAYSDSLKRVNPGIKQSSLFSPRERDARLSLPDQFKVKHLLCMAATWDGPGVNKAELLSNMRNLLEEKSAAEPKLISDAEQTLLESKKNLYQKICDYYHAYNEDKTRTTLSAMGHALTYLWRGHIYNSLAPEDKPFAAIVHHIAVALPEAFNDFCDCVKDQKDFSKASRQVILNHLYDLFTKLQTSEYANLKAFKAREENIINGASYLYKSQRQHDTAALKAEVDHRLEHIHENLKALKKKIHHFAQAFGHEQRIVNIKKHISHRDIAGKHKELDAKYVLAKPGNGEMAVSKEKEARRLTKENNKWLGTIFGVLLAVGETCIGVMGLLSLSTVAAWVLMPFLVVASMICMVHFSRLETIEMLNKLRLDFWGTINYPAKNSTTWIWARYCLTQLSLFVAIAAGFYMGVIILAEVTAVLTTIGIAAAGAFWIALIPAIPTFIAMSCIFFTVLCDFVGNERWNDIGRYFYNTYYVCEMTAGQRLARVPEMLFELIKLVIGLFVCIVVTVMTSGFGYQKGLMLLGATTAAKSISGVLFSINAFARFFFGTHETFEVFGHVRLPFAPKGFASAPAEKKSESKQKRTAVQKLTSRADTAAVVVALGSVGLHVFADGLCFGNDKSTVNTSEKLSKHLGLSAGSIQAGMTASFFGYGMSEHGHLVNESAHEGAIKEVEDYQSTLPTLGG